MRLLFGILLVFSSAISAAGAAGYDDFADGLTAIDRNDSDRAIASFTAALAAGDLNAKFVPVAYLDRARAYLEKGKCALAYSDLTAAIKLKSDFLDGYLVRASADECIGDYVAAASDITQVIALKPTADSYWARGQALWYGGDFSGAAADFDQSAKLAPKMSYSVLWHAMTAMRSGTFDVGAFANDVSALRLDGWPEPIFDLYRGEAKPDDVARAADEGDADVLPAQRCEAKFYSGEWWLAQKNTGAARPFLQSAVDFCPHNFVEKSAAQVELRRMK